MPRIVQIGFPCHTKEPTYISVKFIKTNAHHVVNAEAGELESSSGAHYIFETLRLKETTSSQYFSFEQFPLYDTSHMPKTLYNGDSDGAACALAVAAGDELNEIDGDVPIVLVSCAIKQTKQKEELKGIRLEPVATIKSNGKQQVNIGSLESKWEATQKAFHNNKSKGAALVLIKSEADKLGEKLDIVPIEVQNFKVSSLENQNGPKLVSVETYDAPVLANCLNIPGAILSPPPKIQDIFPDIEEPVPDTGIVPRIEPWDRALTRLVENQTSKIPQRLGTLAGFDRQSFLFIVESDQPKATYNELRRYERLLFDACRSRAKENFYKTRFWLPMSHSSFPNGPNNADDFFQAVVPSHHIHAEYFKKKGNIEEELIVGFHFSLYADELKPDVYQCLINWCKRIFHGFEVSSEQIPSNFTYTPQTANPAVVIEIVSPDGQVRQEIFQQFQRGLSLLNLPCPPVCFGLLYESADHVPEFVEVEQQEMSLKNGLLDFRKRSTVQPAIGTKLVSCLVSILENEQFFNDFASNPKLNPLFVAYNYYIDNNREAFKKTSCTASELLEDITCFSKLAGLDLNPLLDSFFYAIKTYKPIWIVAWIEALMEKRTPELFAIALSHAVQTGGECNNCMDQIVYMCFKFIQSALTSKSFISDGEKLQQEIDKIIPDSQAFYPVSECPKVSIADSFCFAILRYERSCKDKKTSQISELLLKKLHPNVTDQWNCIYSDGMNECNSLTSDQMIYLLTNGIHLDLKDALKLSIENSGDPRSQKVVGQLKFTSDEIEHLISWERDLRAIFGLLTPDEYVELAKDQRAVMKIKHLRQEN